MDKELRDRIEKALAAITPAGAKFSVEGYPVLLLVEVSCNGSDKDFGYHCCLEPGHGGKCFSLNKGVWFTRTN